MKVYNFWTSYKEINEIGDAMTTNKRRDKAGQVFVDNYAWVQIAVQ